jgi:hypothetical protein
MEGRIPAAAGKGAQRDSDRWGDYSTMTLDPTDDCTFWYTAQYQGKSDSDWHTSIIRFKFNARASDRRAEATRFNVCRYRKRSPPALTLFAPATCCSEARGYMPGDCGRRTYVPGDSC